MTTLTTAATHGDLTDQDYRDGAWRCTICGALTGEYLVVDLSPYSGQKGRLIAIVLSPSERAFDSLTLRFDDEAEIVFFRYRLQLVE